MTRDEVQFIRDDDGKPLYALIEHAEYKGFLAAQSRLAFTEKLLHALTQDGELPELIDAEIVHRIAEGESPVRVWREYRGLKAIELAKSAGISAAYLSEIETGKKDGTFKTMTAIATVLGIRLDDLAPAQNVSDQETQSQKLRIKSIKAHMQELNRLIHTTSSFDTAAVRSVALSVRSHIEKLEMKDIEEDWLMHAYETAQNILQLIEEAESTILETASSTRDKLLHAFQAHSPKAPSRSSGSGEKSVAELFSKKRSSSSAA
jgi:transcriptional regulator with XRE-family HTH domain